MPMSASELDTWFKDAARDKLKTLSVSMNITKINYTSATDYSHGVNTHIHVDPATVTTSISSVPFDMSSATSAIYDNDLATGIGSGLVADADDVAASIANAVASTVTAIESTLASYSHTITVCHNSCHTNCHASRGRR